MARHYHNQLTNPFPFLRKQSIIDSVLIEQEKLIFGQPKIEFASAQEIATVYRHLSNSCQQEAVEKGFEDMLAARQ